jgi:hypothetical protein
VGCLQGEPLYGLFFAQGFSRLLAAFPFIPYLTVFQSMASLPSFVELMASLGLEQAAPAPLVERSPSPAPPSSPGSPRTGSPTLPARSSSSPSLRDMATRSRIPRFSPYSHPVVCLHIFFLGVDIHLLSVFHQEKGKFVFCVFFIRLRVVTFKCSKRWYLRSISLFLTLI